MVKHPPRIDSPANGSVPSGERPGGKTREQIQHRHDTFRRTGHFPECGRRGCDETGCAAARLVQRWRE